MKLTRLYTLLLFLPILATAQDKGCDHPIFSDKVKKPLPEYDLKIEYELIKLPANTVSKLLDKHKNQSHPVRLDIQKLVVSEKAEILSTTLLSQLPGRVSKAESVWQYIYPTEYNPSSWPMEPEFRIFNHVNRNPLIFRPKASDILDYSIPGMRAGNVKTPTAFEERPLGIIFETDARVDPHFKDISLDQELETRLLAPNPVKPPLFDKWGQATYDYPRFSRLSFDSGSTLKANKYQLSHVFTGTKLTQLPEESELAVFVRAIVKPSIPK